MPFRVGRRLGALAVAVALVQVAASGAAAAPTAGLLPVCTVPIANPDSTSVVHGRLKKVPAPGVLANDVDLLGSATTVRLVSGVSHGTLSLGTDGSYEYRSDADYVGTDAFRYRIEGCVLGASLPATVTITVTNAAPTASGDSYTAQSGVARTVAAAGVLANDDDADNDPITASLVSGPANGTLSLNANGGFTYTSDAGFGGTDSFRYRATDGIANSPAVTVQIAVTAPTPKPTAAPTPTPTPIVTIPSPDPLSTPTLPPIPGATPSPSPTPTAGGSGGPAPSATPTPRPTSGGTGQGGALPPGPGGSAAPSAGPGTTPGPQEGPFGVGATEDEPVVELEPGSFALASFEWAVPVLTLTVPGLLLVIAVIAQASLGLAWIPIARRSLEIDRRRRRTYARAS